MSLPSQVELVRRVQEVALAAVSPASSPPSSSPSSAPSSPPAVVSEGPSAMEQDGTEATPASTAVWEGAIGRATAGGDGENGVGTAVEAWAELLPLERNWHKTVYTLQIVDALLLPAAVSTFLWSVIVAVGYVDCVFSSDVVCLWRQEEWSCATSL